MSVAAPEEVERDVKLGFKFEGPGPGVRFLMLEARELLRSAGKSQRVEGPG